MSLKIGVTGNKGFIGSHLVNFLGLKESVELIPFSKDKFQNDEDLIEFVTQCDVIVHLAALNRHSDAEVIYNTNIKLVKLLISACESAKVTPHILISSSTQESKSNLYGQSKKDGRELLEQWGQRTGAIVNGLIIPNVFGPFCKPFYNSVVATFCHQLASGEMPTIHQDGTMKMIYINELVQDIYNVILNKSNGIIEVKPRHEFAVSDLLMKLVNIRDLYFLEGKFPEINNSLHLALFNTFRCYIPHDHYPVKFTKHEDARGAFVEIARTETSGQFSFSSTVPGITRGNHFHTRKAERFAVIRGKAKISLRKIDTNEVIDYIIDGSEPAYVDMPIWYTHNITNIGEEELLTLFWINEAYDPDDADTYFVNV